ncbi:unnamed protein product [Mytilus edulis]|uniref:Uncharacterized protein n=1 Tax=Mytilus edulis TaxID=6550 RepID=A0A8S3UJH2_MYTED|nr:unnamed protein product [Mytilus edulis]
MTKWKSGDDPIIIHRMLSPSCALVAEPRFSSSANQEERTTVVSNNTDSTVDTRTVTIQGLNQSENASTSEPSLELNPNGASNNLQERQENQLYSSTNRDNTSSATGNESSQETQTSNETIMLLVPVHASITPNSNHLEYTWKSLSIQTMPA